MNAINTDSVSALQAALVRQRVDTAVLAKTRQVADEQAQAVLGLLDAAVRGTNQSGAPSGHRVAASVGAEGPEGTEGIADNEGSEGANGHHVDVTV